MEQYTPKTYQQIQLEPGYSITDAYGKTHQAKVTDPDYILSRMAQEQENAFNVQMWNAENEYNLPVNQMQRFQDAGLNPNLIYGQQNTSASAPSAGSLPNFGVKQNKLSKRQKTIQNIMDAVSLFSGVAGTVASIAGRTLQNKLLDKQISNFTYLAESNRQDALNKVINNYSKAYNLLGPKMFEYYAPLINGEMFDTPFAQWMTTPQGYEQVKPYLGFDSTNLMSDALRAGINNKKASTALFKTNKDWKELDMNRLQATIENIEASTNLRKQEHDYQDLYKGAITRILHGNFNWEDLLSVIAISLLSRF